MSAPNRLESRPGTGRLLEVDELVVHFRVRGGGTVHAVDGISFHVGVGETLGLVGESGSGKSTTGMAVVRRHDPLSGRIAFEGKDITTVGGSDLRRLRRHMQVIFQDPYSSLNPRMKIGDLVAEPLIVHGLAKRGPPLRQRVAALLEKCGLPATAVGRFPNAFSGGERQRIAIARALAVNPKLIVADEAVSALDVSIQAQIINLLADLQREESLSYLFISHNLAVVSQVAHRIAILYAGKIMEVGTAADILRRPVHPYTKSLLSASPIPDPVLERGRERIVLRGEVPSALAPPAGCRFVTRCPWAEQRCHEPQVLEEKSPGRLASCWRAPTLGKPRPAHPLPEVSADGPWRD